MPQQDDPRTEIAHRVGDVLNGSGLDRDTVAARASELAGKSVTKYMLDAYSAPGRPKYNIPAWLVPIVEKVCGSRAITEYQLGQHKGLPMYGRDVLLYDLGTEVRKTYRTEQSIQELHDQLDRQ